MSANGEGTRTGRWFNAAGVGILALSYTVAIVHMFSVRRAEQDPDTVTIRITHWQLEAGVREGIDALAREFEETYRRETGRRVRVIQNAISERVYAQYVQTQCIGRTAPDLIEIGMYDGNYTRRYFVPNTEAVNQPNPYNAGTALADVPWAETFRDGMESCLDGDTFEYYGAAMGTVSLRVFYNRPLLREAVGLDAPPDDYRGFLDVCERLRLWAERTGRKDFVPIAAARYQLRLFAGRFTNLTVFDYGMTHSRLYDGLRESFWEVVDDYAAGREDFGDPAIRAGYEMLGRVTRYFPPGFMSQDRMEASFRFTTGKAAFITSGTWDAGSFFVQADFPVGVVDFALPDRDDPDFGRFVRGRLSEPAGWGGLRLGITKFCKHPDVALRFMQFATTPERNEAFNRRCKWIPLVRGARPHPTIAAFELRPEGFWGVETMPFWGGTRAGLLYDQCLWDFVEHKIDFDGFLRRLREKLPEELALDVQERVRADRDRIQNLRPQSSYCLAAHLFAGTWGGPEGERARETAQAARRLACIWETEAYALWTTFWHDSWLRNVRSGAPNARRMQAAMTQDLGLGE
jgi:raffinose/stachyose/melibiose transport system substrate-binding protein